VANGIILPHAMRFNLPVAAAALAEAAWAMDSRADTPSAAAEDGIARVSALIASLGLPRRLRDVGVTQDALPRLAHLALQSRAVHTNPRPVTAVAEVEALLRAAW
jgi:alcohol dehydrogenase class IV